MGGPCVVDGRPRGELDNFHECRIRLEGRVWPSAEHYYQASKFPEEEEDIREQIRLAESGWSAYKLGNVSGPGLPGLQPGWEEVKVDVMYRGNFAKFSQNPELRRTLAATRGAISAKGNFWKTWNEILLERIREEVRGHDERDSAVLLNRISLMEGYRAAARTGDAHAVAAVTKWAAQRLAPPSPDPGTIAGVAVAGHDASLHPWIGGSAFVLDVLTPTVNGQPHYRNKAGGHLSLGAKNGKLAWVIDECFCATETTGTAYVDADEGGGVPIGTRTWRCWDGNAHVTRDLTLTAAAH